MIGLLQKGGKKLVTKRKHGDKSTRKAEVSFTKQKYDQYREEMKQSVYYSVYVQNRLPVLS